MTDSPVCSSRYSTKETSEAFCAKSEAVPVCFRKRENGNTPDDLTAMRVAAALSKVVKPNFRDGRFPDFRNVK